MCIIDRYWLFFLLFFFFFKQKTAYEIGVRLVGSEMCIRDSTEVLRDEWGFDGLVMSDWDAVNIREHGVAAGLDLEMPTSEGVGQQRIVDAVRAGTLSEAAVDLAARRVLELVNRSLPSLVPRRAGE